MTEIAELAREVIEHPPLYYPRATVDLARALLDKQAYCDELARSLLERKAERDRYREALVKIGHIAAAGWAMREIAREALGESEQ
jgi:hypothetical protein